MKAYVLGIDIGTSACKVIAFTPSGEEAASAEERYKVYYPEAGYAEQDADEWAAAAFKAISRVTERIGGENIAAVGVDGQSWSAVMCDREGEALARVPIWFDRRAELECREIAERVGEKRAFRCSGNPLEPTYAAPKVLWFKKNAPEVYRNTYAILGSNAYIVKKLTGAFSQDVSQGYGYCFFDLEKRAYDRTMIDELGLSAEHYPEPIASHKVVGYVSREAAALSGLTEGTPVVAGGLDSACGALGTGTAEPEICTESSGTSGGITLCTSTPIRHKALIATAHVVPDCWLLQGGTSGGGGSMAWLSEQLKMTPAELDREAESIPPGSDGVIFLPYMAGERSPIWDSRAKGVFFGLSYATGRAHMTRALLEGVAFSLLHNVRTAEKAGAKIRLMYPCGGASRSRIWTEIKADVTGIPFKVPKTANATTLGAAMLGAVGVGVFGDFPEAIEKMTSFSREHIPHKYEAYDRNYEKYRELYESVKHIF